MLSLRHWIGRAGQDQRLYQGILDTKVFTPREAETALRGLLHDFGDDELARSVTYEELINLLGSDKRSHSRPGLLAPVAPGPRGEIVRLRPLRRRSAQTPP